MKSSILAADRRHAPNAPILLLAAALTIGLASPSIALSGAPGASAVQAIRARRDHFHALGKATKSLRQQLKYGNPGWNEVTADVNQIVQLATALPSWFPAGSGRSAGVKTKARSTIWTNPQGFARAAQNFSDRAHDLAQAVARRDPDATRQQARAMGRACGGCHHEFRARDSWW